jgi:hypothetical protein
MSLQLSTLPGKGIQGLRPYAWYYLATPKVEGAYCFAVAPGAKPVRPLWPSSPCRCNRKVPISLNREVYKKRNAIERFFSCIKEFRRIATRYEKTAILFQAMVTIGCIVTLLQL